MWTERAIRTSRASSRAASKVAHSEKDKKRRKGQGKAGETDRNKDKGSRSM